MFVLFIFDAFPLFTFSCEEKFGTDALLYCERCVWRLVIQAYGFSRKKKEKITRCDGSITLLSCRVPHLELDSFSFQFDGADFKVHPNSTDVAPCVGVVRKPLQQARLPNAGISDGQKLQKVIVFRIDRRHSSRSRERRLQLKIPNRIKESSFEYEKAKLDFRRMRAGRCTLMTSSYVSASIQPEKFTKAWAQD